MKRLLVIGIVIAVIIILGVGIVLSKSTVNPKTIAVMDVTATDSKIDLKGSFTNSSLQYKGYTAEYKNEILYISIKGGLVSFSKPKDMNISMENTYGKIKEIYLQGDTASDNVLIYPRDKK